jgi:hypothetical protein
MIKCGGLYVAFDDRLYSILCYTTYLLAFDMTCLRFCLFMYVHAYNVFYSNVCVLIQLYYKSILIVLYHATTFTHVGAISVNEFSYIVPQFIFTRFNVRGRHVALNDKLHSFLCDAILFTGMRCDM